MKKSRIGIQIPGILVKQLMSCITALLSAFMRTPFSIQVSLLLPRSKDFQHWFSHLVWSHAYAYGIVSWYNLSKFYKTHISFHPASWWTTLLEMTVIPDSYPGDARSIRSDVLLFILSYCVFTRNYTPPE